MEALDFVKLHSLYAHFSSMIENTYPLFTSGCYDDDQEEDSFFDLEFISAPPLQTTILAGESSPHAKTSGEKNPIRFGENELQGLLLSQPDLISKRKILPFELSSKPESPASVSLPKSAPRFSMSLFKKPKLMVKPKVEETEQSPRKQQSGESKRFAFKLTRVNSSRNNNHKDSFDRRSKGFSREGMGKYLKLIKPLYVKVSKRYNHSSTQESSLPKATSIVNEKQRNSAVGIRVVCRRLGKCKPSSSAAQPTNRRDDSLLQQHDGIEGAILHCKRSFNASRGRGDKL